MDDPVEPAGTFPHSFYKVFDKEEWARAFVEKGTMRLSTLEYFASLGDPIRQDGTEGESQTLIPGDVMTLRLGDDGSSEVTSAPGRINFSGTWAQPIYVCCFTCPPQGDESKLPRKFGSFVVKIHNPRKLAEDLTAKLTEENKLRGTPQVECWPVVYTKGLEGERIADHFTRTRLHFTQKPPSYADEYEYRFAVISTNERAAEMGDHCVVHLGPLSYATLLP